MNISSLVDLYKFESKQIIDAIDTQVIVRFVNFVLSAYQDEKKIFACGNGGNAAFVSNLVADLNIHPFVSDDKSRQSKKRNKFCAISLCESPAVITGLSNDLGFSSIFKEQLRYQAEAGDILFCLSGSGNSQNIIEALEFGREIGMICVTVTRKTPCKAQNLSDLLIEVTGTSTFPGQTGGNNNNFHFEDFISKLSHIVTGILKHKVSESS